MARGTFSAGRDMPIWLVILALLACAFEWGAK
jgi:hypothetical protein